MGFKRFLSYLNGRVHGPFVAYLDSGYDFSSRRILNFVWRRQCWTSGTEKFFESTKELPLRGLPSSGRDKPPFLGLKVRKCLENRDTRKKEEGMVSPVYKTEIT